MQTIALLAFSLALRCNAQPAIAGVVSGSAVTPTAAAADAPALTRIRTGSPVIASLIQDATERSPTFHQMVDTISATDGVVYLEQGTCGHGVRACLVLSVTMAGPYRMLRILVDPRKADSNLQGSIGHELWHAIEVLSNPTVRSDGALYHLYERGSSFQDQPFETTAAIQTGEIVRKELGARRAYGKLARETSKSQFFNRLQPVPPFRCSDQQAIERTRK